VGRDTWNTLRVEAGRPGFASELAEEVIPVEAGIHDRAIDYTKGCYTGQEVIVRIRDRGRVNRNLRRLRLDIEAPLPAPGTELFREKERPVGHLTSVTDSPREGKIALGYVRREVEPGQTVNVGGVDGPRARVEALDGDGA
jgi:folate-binding protein YgfZ